MYRVTTDQEAPRENLVSADLVDHGDSLGHLDSLAAQACREDRYCNNHTNMCTQAYNRSWVQN